MSIRKDKDNLNILTLEDLQISEIRYRRLFESARDGILILDAETRKITDVNPFMMELLGYTRKEFLGKELWEIGLLKDEEASIAAFRELQKDDYIRYENLPLKTKSGEQREVEFTSNVNTENGRQVVLCNIRDITERKRAETALQASEERFNVFMDASPATVWMKDENFRYVYMNRAWENALGLKKEEWLGKTDYEMAPPEVADVIRKNDLVGLQTGEQVAVIEETGEIGGHHYYWNIIKFPFRDASGQLLLGNIAVDITKQTNAENALRESETRFRQLVESSIIGIIIADIKGTVIEANDVFLKIIGYSREELLAGKIQWDEMTPLMLHSPDENIHLTDGSIESGDVKPREKEYMRKDGSSVPVLVGGTLLKGSDNTFIAFVLDITERKLAEEVIQKLHTTLEQRTINLEAANKELEAFSYSVSHDLRAPLRAIDGFSRALLEDYAEQIDDVGKNYLERVCAASQHMAQLIDDLLNLSRVTRSEIHFKNVNLSSLANDIAEKLCEGEPERTVKFDIKDEIIVSGDERLLRIVLQNLFDNAWKFTSKLAQAEITFGQIANDDKIEYFVRDDGAGFDMTYADKLFGVFQRLHTVKEFEGTGIGLVTVQRIVHRHGGVIRAEAKEGEGATFYFTL